MKYNNKKLGYLYILFIFIFSFSFSIYAASVKAIWSVSSFGDNDFFYKPSDMEADLNRSLLYIVDSGNNRVLIFDFEGKLVKIIGSKGQGPAEFANPTGICILKDSKLAVADRNNNRIQIFDKSWHFLKSINTKETRVADMIFVGDRIYTISSFGYSGYSLEMSSEQDIQSLVNILDKEGNRLQSILTHDFPDQHPFLRAIKSRVCLALSPEGRIYLAYFALNLIQVFNYKGEKVDEFKRLLPFKPMTPKLVTQKNLGQGRISMAANLDFVTREALFGPDGNLYLLTYLQSNKERRKKQTKNEELPPHPMRIEIINPKTHKVLKYISCDPGTKAFAVMGVNRLAYIYEDSEGEVTLKCVEY